MTIFAKFNENGLSESFWDDGVHEVIPTGAVEINNEQWQDLLSNPALRRWDGQKIVEVAPPTIVLNPYLPLKPYQFWTAVRATGHEADLHTWVANMSDPIEKSYASAVLEFSLEFRYDHPLMQVALQVLGLTVEEFQTLWLWALDL